MTSECRFYNVTGNECFYKTFSLEDLKYNTCSLVYGSGHCLQLDGHICLHNKKKSSNKRIISFQVRILFSNRYRDKFVSHDCLSGSFLLQFDSTDPSRVMVASADSQVRIISGRNVVYKYKGNMLITLLGGHGFEMQLMQNFEMYFLSSCRITKRGKSDLGVFYRRREAYHLRV